MSYQRASRVATSARGVSQQHFVHDVLGRRARAYGAVDERPQSRVVLMDHGFESGLGIEARWREGAGPKTPHRPGG